MQHDPGLRLTFRREKALTLSREVRRWPDGKIEPRTGCPAAGVASRRHHLLPSHLRAAASALARSSGLRSCERLVEHGIALAGAFGDKMPFEALDLVHRGAPSAQQHMGEAVLCDRAVLAGGLAQQCHRGGLVLSACRCRYRARWRIRPRHRHCRRAMPPAAAAPPFPGPSGRRCLPCRRSRARIGLPDCRRRRRCAAIPPRV